MSSRVANLLKVFVLVLSFVAAPAALAAGMEIEPNGASVSQNAESVPGN